MIVIQSIKYGGNMFSEKVRKVLTEAYKIEYQKDPTDQQLQNFLFYDGKEVDEIDRECHRWWDTLTIIKQYDLGQKGMYFIGYGWAYANRDENIFYLGWQFDPDTVSFYEPYTITTIKYRDKSQQQVQM